ncbi:hypothetical protein [Alloactinosynnema sp. L-07]|uniref:hypothetical protein n=1 Tax=Alloactinosynnema sp. L-07 TaxID=1653480 RepID=UPI00065EEF9A|nr:hypothetical protein [Alloactinosynnema sp. L-07]CRK56294.1 hypothetical protein [Alloactinosynnema sp. L-07]
MTPFEWQVYEPDGPTDRKELYWVLPLVVIPVGLMFVQPMIGVLALGMLPAVIGLARHARSDARGITRVRVDPGPAREIELRRPRGRPIVGSLDDITALRRVIVGYRGGSSDPKHTVEISFGRKRYRTSDRFTTADHDPKALLAALQLACPSATTLPTADRTQYVTDD